MPIDGLTVISLVALAGAAFAGGFWLAKRREPDHTSDARRLGLPGLVLTDGSFIPMELGRDDALVLFEWTYQFCTDARPDFHHHAEAAVLEKIGGDLERFMHEPFMANYGEQLAQARERVWSAYSSQWIAKIPLAARSPSSSDKREARRSEDPAAKP